MNRRWGWARGGFACCAWASAACNDAWADRGPAYGPAASAEAASASASVSALPPEEQAPPVEGRKAWAPQPPEAPVPETASEKPARAEWEKAPMAEEARITQPRCEVRRIREWYRVKCGGHIGASLVMGSQKGVELVKTWDKERSFVEELAIVFPAKRGDARLFQLFTFSKWAPGTPDVMVSEQWMEGDPHPMISVQGLRGSF